MRKTNTIRSILLALALLGTGALLVQGTPAHADEDAASIREAADRTKTGASGQRYYWHRGC